MNPKHLTVLSNHFNLGSLFQEPERVFGGLLHIMWRLTTEKGSYAIKQLSNNIDLTNSKIIQNYETSEDMAFIFSQNGVPAVSAIKKVDKHLFIIDEVGYLVYPWVEAKALDQHVISEYHALKMAEILAKMHALSLNNAQITEPKIAVHTQEKILKVIEKAQDFNCEFYTDLQKNQENILTINESYQQAIPIQYINPIICHGDLDQKNVLWHKHNPIILDWESTCKVNATYDFINTAFYWSGITTVFNKNIFLKMVEVYQQSGGVLVKQHLRGACYGPFGWIDWLIYNIERACVKEESESKKMGIYEVNQTLVALLRLKISMPEIINIVSEIR